jgi:signal transduction histidine kinase
MRARTVGLTIFERVGFIPWMFGDRSGALWLTPLFGLWRLRDRKILAVESSERLPEPAARAFYQDRRGWLWIGSRYKGVSMTTDPTDEHPRFVSYSTQNGLASDTVWCITEDDVGRIYVGTGKGLDRLDPTTGRIRHFTSADGLAGDLINHCMKDRGGHIWVATTTGLSKLNPRAEHPPTQPPPIYLSWIQVAGDALPLPETGAERMPELTLPPGRNNLLIEYVGISFRGEQALQYQYQLEGVDADWSLPTEQRSVNYARLAPGSYRFLVRAINRDGETSREPAVFEFRILPPIWQRGWFLVLAAGVAGSVVYALHRYRVARLIELERVRTRIATDLHDDIGAALSQMAILSEVVKQHPTVTQPELAQMLTHIADMARSLVDGMSDIVWSIDPRRDDLSHLIERIGQFAFDVLRAKGIAWELQTQPPSATMKLTPDQRRHIYLIFKEAITNIARHAHCTSVLLTLKVTDHRLSAEIHDDGCGFDRARPTDETRPMRRGHGLENMQARAAELGGHLQIESTPGQGTRVTFTIPL